MKSHLAKPSDMAAGEEIYLKVDQTLTHDINAVMTYLAFEAIGLERTQLELSVSNLDHNLLYLDFKTPDDHIYLQSAEKCFGFGIYVSRAGNGRWRKLRAGFLARTSGDQPHVLGRKVRDSEEHSQNSQGKLNQSRRHSHVIHEPF